MRHELRSEPAAPVRRRNRDSPHTCDGECLAANQLTQWMELQRGDDTFVVSADEKRVGSATIDGITQLFLVPGGRARCAGKAVGDQARDCRDLIGPRKTEGQFGGHRAEDNANSTTSPLSGGDCGPASVSAGS